MAGRTRFVAEEAEMAQRRGLRIATAAAALGALIAVPDPATGASHPGSAAPVPPQVEVHPTTGLVDFDTVHVVATGFIPGELVWVRQCVVSPVPGYQPNPCRANFSFTADDHGRISTDVVVRRIVGSAGTGPFDCASSPGRCVLRVGPVTTGTDEESFHALSFDPDAPVIAPKLTVAPDVRLTDGQAVDVHGTFFSPRAFVGVAQCRSDASDASGCDLARIVLVYADYLGNLDTTFEVRSRIEVGGGPVDCAAVPGSCAVGAMNLGDNAEGAKANLTFGDPPVVSAGMAGIWEGGRRDHAVIRVPVFLSGASALPVSVEVSTRARTALRHRDFVPVRETVVFEPGELRGHVEIEIVGDRRPEPLEMFVVRLRDAQNAEIGGVHGLGFALIWDDDPPR